MRCVVLVPSWDYCMLSHHPHYDVLEWAGHWVRVCVCLRVGVWTACKSVCASAFFSPAPPDQTRKFPVRPWLTDATITCKYSCKCCMPGDFEEWVLGGEHLQTKTCCGKMLCSYKKAFLICPLFRLDFFFVGLSDSPQTVLSHLCCSVHVHAFVCLCMLLVQTTTNTTMGFKRQTFLLHQQK